MSTNVVVQLEEFLLTKLHVDWTPPQKPDSQDLCNSKLSFDYDVAQHADEPRRYRLMFRVSVKPSDTPPVGYSIDAEIAGIFLFPEGTPEDRQHFLLLVNGATILYGILRGQIGMTTGGFVGGKYNLPTVMMQQVMPEIEERKAKAKAAQSSKRKQGTRRKVSSKSVAKKATAKPAAVKAASKRLAKKTASTKRTAKAITRKRKVSA